MDLKQLNPQSLPLVDKLNRHYSQVPIILILSPSSYQLLNSHGLEIRKRSIILLSEPKSFDYLLQIPRLMEEVRRKKRLKTQNERLQRYILQKASHIHKDWTTRHQWLQDLQARIKIQSPSSCGFKVVLKSWKTAKKEMHEIAQTEVLETLSRLLRHAVRKTDHILHFRDNEFHVLLSNANHLRSEQCLTRIETLLKDFSLKANDRPLDLPFSIGPL